MKLRALLILIVVYVLIAFGWLTYSLLNFSSNEYTLKKDVLKAGLNACTLQVMQAAKNGKLGEDTTAIYYLKQLRLEVNPDELIQFVQTNFAGNYQVNIDKQGGHKEIQLVINADRIDQLEKEQAQQKRMWWFQTSILFLLVIIGIIGVYYSINSLYSLNKQQNNFLLSVTHEFKTPIAAIRLMMQTLKNPKVKDDKKVELIDKSIQNTHRLEELTENMLTAMQIEYNKYQFDPQAFDLSDLLNRIIRNHEIKGVINASIEEDLVYHGDQFILRIALSNLIENAFKYSDHQPIDVELKSSKDSYILSVKDKGVGIPKSEFGKIFDKFYRVQDEETRTTKGTGLGLFIVKQAVLKHGGKIWASYNAPKGMVFTITLPLQL